MIWQRCVSHSLHYIHIADTRSLLGVVLISVSAKIGVKGHFSLSSSSSYLTPPKVTIPMGASGGGKHKGWRSRTLPIGSINKPTGVHIRLSICRINGYRSIWKVCEFVCYVWHQNAILSAQTSLNTICYLVAILSVISASGAANIVYT